MQANYPTYLSPAKTPRSLGQMIRDQEMAKTQRILNPAQPKRRQRSFADRYQGVDYLIQPAADDS